MICPRCGRPCSEEVIADWGCCEACDKLDRNEEMTAEEERELELDREY